MWKTFKIVYSLETTKTTDLFILGVRDGAKAPLINSTAKKWERVCRQNWWHEQFFSFHSCEIFLRKKSCEQSTISLTDRFAQALAHAEGRYHISICLGLWYEGGHPWWKGRVGDSGSKHARLRATPEGMMMHHYCCFSHQTSNFILIQPAAKDWSSCWLPQWLGVPRVSPGEGYGGKTSTAPAGESRAALREKREEEDGDPLESLQNGSSREVNPHETRLYQSCCLWSNVTHAGISFRKVKEAGEALRQTVAREFLIKHRICHLQSMIPLSWWPVWWIPFDFWGTWLGCYVALGIRNVIWKWCAQRIKQHFVYDKINIYLLFFLLLASSNTQPEKEYHFYICPGIRKHCSLSVQKKFFLSAMGKMIVLPWTMKGLTSEYCFMLK